MAESEQAPVRAIVELRKLQDLLIAVQLGISEAAIKRLTLEKIRTIIGIEPEHIMRAAAEFRAAEEALNKAVQATIQAHIDLVTASDKDT